MSARASFRNTLAMIFFASPLMVGFATAADGYQAPLNEFGQPDISGTWSYASLTFLERPGLFEDLVVTAEQAQPFIEGFLGRNSQLGDPDTELGGVDSLMQVNEEYRSSMIVDPVDGKLPLTETGRAVAAEYGARFQNFDGPEMRDLDERCLGSIGYPPLITFIVEIPTKIVQTAGYVMMKTEDPTLARIIRLSDEHSAVGPRSYAGSSTGYYDGQTLVVTSSHFRNEHLTRLAIGSSLIIGPDARVTERFTPTAAGEMLYEFTVEDETHYSRPWAGEFAMQRIDDVFYEYSCHEGNYSMPGILLGGRREQADAAAGQ